MSFGKKWLGWIKWCISTTSFFVITDGKSKRFFQKLEGFLSRGSLIPLFVSQGMEVFTILMDKVVRKGFLLGCTIEGRDEIFTMSHLLFADDTLVFCRNSEEQLVNLS